jgi:prepilin-type N-terminal cleavage/methylation domain-containing protein
MFNLASDFFLLARCLLFNAVAAEDGGGLESAPFTDGNVLAWDPVLCLYALMSSSIHDMNHNRGATGFTLIELLVVIAVIAILAALLFPVVKSIDRIRRIARARGELAQIQTCIESYKASLGYYPPDNRSPLDHQLLPGLNPLFYELDGTVFTSDQMFVDKGKVAPALTTNMIISFFGSGVSGFMNSDRGNADDGQGAGRFLKVLKHTQIAQITQTNKTTKMTVTGDILVCTVPGPDPNTPPLNDGSPALNPWRYNSSSPTNNSSTYDLWVDIFTGSKVTRLCNWSAQPLILP